MPVEADQTTSAFVAV